MTIETKPITEKEFRYGDRRPAEKDAEPRRSLVTADSGAALLANPEVRRSFLGG